MNQPAHSRAKLVASAERELSAFLSAAGELFGPGEATLAAEDWLQCLTAMKNLPNSPRKWRVLSIEASTRLAKRVNAKGFGTSR
jgi:hypothetical protein